MSARPNTPLPSAPAGPSPPQAGGLPVGPGMARLLLSADAPSTQPVDLLDSICTFGESDSDLVTGFPGGFWIRQADQGVPYPYAIVFQVGGGVTQATTGPDRVTSLQVQFSVFAGTNGATGASSYEESMRLAYLVQAKYHGLILTFQNGYTMAAESREPFGMAPTDARGGSRIVQSVVLFDYMIGRTIPRNS